MDRIEAAVRKLSEAVMQLTDAIPAPPRAKALAYSNILECQEILEAKKTLELGDAPGPADAIANAANRQDPEGPLDDPASLFRSMGGPA